MVSFRRERVYDTQGLISGPRDAADPSPDISTGTTMFRCEIDGNGMANIVSPSSHGDKEETSVLRPTFPLICEHLSRLGRHSSGDENPCQNDPVRNEADVETIRALR